jgi:sigma-B regulation protein RsbU (phosphoserine phosphatase)
MQSGDVLILYTDGVTEAMDSDRNLFEEERLRNLLESKIVQSAEDVPREIMKAVKIFEGGTDQTDDCTILAFQYNGPVAKSDDEIWTMTIKNQLSEISKVINGIAKFCQELPVPLSPGRKLKIVLDEILNNTISYGYDDEQEQEIRIEVEPIADGIILTIRDAGNAFNPLECDTPDTDLSIDDRSPGGLGLHLVKNMVDDVRYMRVDETNVLSLTLYFDRQTNEADTSGSSSAD